MTAVILDFDAIEQGATFEKVLRLTDSEGTAIDLTGCTAKMQFRTAYGGPVVSELSTTNGKITIVALSGSITMTIPASETEDFNPGSLIYDLELTWPGGKVDRLIQGKTKISQEVTK